MANLEKSSRMQLTIKDFCNKKGISAVQVYGKSSITEDGNFLSFSDQAAIVSHYLQLKNRPEGVLYKKNAEQILNEWSSWMDEDMTDAVAHGDMVSEPPVFQLNLFHDLLNAPFHDSASPKFTFVDLFAGIGGIRIPFTELGGKCVFSSEWDKAAQISYSYNFGEVPFGDITKINSDSIPKHDVLLAGFPCQAFSIIGKMKGFADTRGTMFFEVARILQHHQPKAILLENVKQLVSHDGGKTFKVILDTLAELGYSVKWKILNALDFGLPQKRERVIIVGFKSAAACEQFNFDFEPIAYDLASVLEDDKNVDSSLFASDMILDKRRKRVEGKNVFYPSVWHENKSGNISILPYACALRTGASYNYLLINGYRRPSSRELLRFQGFPEKFKIEVSHQEIRRQTGNSVAVPMIRAVAKKIIQLL
ncbi:MAG: DNA (cytosine-5-)-methyltransferase [Sodaliphilus sp.]|nr:DNA (cytosine-5-)-methyltransferase [Bacteroidales bacterium]MDY3683617.1 DNA (cytosine-5-)-methyltransferase [Sodaliphilus sp.]MCI6334698.1 DNA (cytosine-5-)-methyltransferase [Bacteroidales bacterium]MCI7317322.1 DNA (cytosine-5-)-methyltransferase [Bacteroidales bacterium]MDD7163453.1 DNA (cytosine-5-)-methyltransferase [Bacteroidales bacterium]